MSSLNPFPEDREAKRRVLMDAVESVRDILEAGAEEGEETGTLPQASVDALYDSGLAPPQDALRAGRRRSRPGHPALTCWKRCAKSEPSAGWCLMIGAASMGGVGAFLPDDAIEEIFANGNPPKTAGVFAPFGKAVPVDGGYLLSGQVVLRQRHTPLQLDFLRRPRHHRKSQATRPRSGPLSAPPMSRFTTTGA